MKTIVGLVIVGMCMLVSIANAEDIEASNFARVVLTNGESYTCHADDIAAGCRMVVDEKFVTILNKPVTIPSNTASMSWIIETRYINYKFPMNNVVSIEYR